MLRSLQLFHRFFDGYRGTIGMALIAASLAACTTTTITPQSVQGPEESYKVAALGDITAQDKLNDYLIGFFRRGFVARLNEIKAFETVLDPATSPPPSSSILLTGTISEVDKGSKAARFLIGFGAGRAHITGAFEIRDASGRPLGAFENRKAYSGGAGIGGFDMLNTEELMEKFGADTADALARWSKGEPLTPPNS